MISYNKTSGDIRIVEKNSGVYSVFLYDFEGTLTPDSDVVSIKIIASGSNTVSNEVSLSNHDNLDCIILETLEASDILIGGMVSTLVLMQGEVEIGGEIQCNTCRIDRSNLAFSEFDAATPGISAQSHVWVVDSSVSNEGSGPDVIIQTSYLLVDNSKMNLSADSVFLDWNSDPLSTSKNLSIENCKNINVSASSAQMDAICTDASGFPVPFLIYRREDTEEVVTRLHPYSKTAAVKADSLDLFRRFTGYTSPDLLRYIDSNDLIYPDLRISALNSYRMINQEDPDIEELP